jgi:hypothetical protein
MSCTTNTLLQYVRHIYAAFFSLAGAVPGKYLQANIDSLIKVSSIYLYIIFPLQAKNLYFLQLQGIPLPYEGYDAFEEESHYPFDTTAGGAFCAPKEINKS